MIEEMILQIREFYPFVDDANPEEKNNRRNTIIEKKIMDIINGKQTAWTSLVSEVQSFWPNVIDMEAMQFPGYMLRIKLEVANEWGKVISRERHVILCVSLLSRFFTTFVEEKYSFHEMKQFPEEYSPSFIFFFDRLTPEYSFGEAQLLEQVAVITQKHFPEHLLTPHQVPMVTTLENGLQSDGEREYQPRSVFSYLFNDQISDPYVVH